jgi:sec-independent protein translocase protein TatA
MGSMSLFHWLIVLVVVILIFGTGKIPRLADDIAKGIKAFRHGMREDENTLKPDAGAEKIPPHEPPPSV